jgi:hypothetical protein
MPEPTPPEPRRITTEELAILRGLKFKCDRATLALRQAELALEAAGVDMAERHGVDLTRNAVDLETGIILPRPPPAAK